MNWRQRLTAAILCAVLSRSAADLKARCNALGGRRVYRHQTCLVLPEGDKDWAAAVDSCDHIPPGDDSAAGHLWHAEPTGTDAVHGMISWGLSWWWDMYAGVYDGGGGDSDSGWYYVVNSTHATAAQMRADMWPWASGPDDAPPRAVQVRIYPDGGTNRYDAPLTNSMAYVCQYDKAAGVKWERVSAFDGRRPSPPAELRVERKVANQLVCQMRCVHEWGASLCRAIAYDRAAKVCVHSLALPTNDQWMQQGSMINGKVWQLQTDD